MVIRDSRYPRLAREYHGEIIYATPGCGKTYISDKYRDVLDADELMVEAIRELSNFNVPSYDDPRKVIFRYFRFINFNPWKKQMVYDRCVEKMLACARDDDVVLCGTVDLMHVCDRFFIEQEEGIVRDGFREGRARSRECSKANMADVPVHWIDSYLEKAMQKTAERLRRVTVTRTCYSDSDSDCYSDDSYY